MTLPFAGHPVGAPDLKSAQNAEDQIESAYRFLLGDAMPFGRNARIQLEHGGENESTERYRTVTYWYGLPSACLVLADSFRVGDPADSGAHEITSVGATEALSISSRYEAGVDVVDGMVISPETFDTGRIVEKGSSFRLSIPPDNLGVLLRRKLDYGLADQRAMVWVAEDHDGAPFAYAGEWYLAGSTTALSANPPTELGTPTEQLMVSPRRWRDDEFLLPSRLTAGRSAIRVRLDVVPQTLPVVPSAPGPLKQGWSEFRYWAYAYRMPAFP